MDSEEKQPILHHSFMEDNPLTLSGKDETLINLADKEKSRYPDRVLLTLDCVTLLVNFHSNHSQI